MVLEMPTRTLEMEQETDKASPFEAWDGNEVIDPNGNLDDRDQNLDFFYDLYHLLLSNTIWPLLAWAIQWSMDVPINTENQRGFQSVGVKSVHNKNSRIRDGFIQIFLLDESLNHLGMLVSNLTDLEVMLSTSSDMTKKFFEACFIVTEFCEKVVNVDWLCRQKAYICFGKVEVRTTKVFGDGSENITEDRANILINKGLTGTG